MNKDKSFFYKQGYKTGFGLAILILKSHCNDDALVNKLISEFNKCPLIDEMNIDEFSEKIDKILDNL